MPLQKQVYMDLAVAVPGQKATPDQSVYTPQTFVADEAGVRVGTFCFASSTPGAVSSTTTGSDAPVGFVERAISTYIYDVTAEATDRVAAGQALNIARRGDYYVQVTEACQAGGQVYVDKTTGDILAAAGANGVAAPGWTFQSAGEADDIVIISNWSVPATSGGDSGGAVDLSNVTGTLGVANGGTGATSADAARTSLGLGALSTKGQVDLTADVTGALPVANGGTGATDAATARTNLGAAASA